MVVPLIKDEFEAGLTDDLVVDGRPGVRGWINARLHQIGPGRNVGRGLKFRGMVSLFEWNRAAIRNAF